MLRQHQASLDDRKKFTALVKDLFPDQAKNVNLLLMAYNMGIAQDIQSASHINNTFAFRYVKQLMDDFGMSRVNADWIVSVWCFCYGGKVLGKACDISIQKQGRGPAIQGEQSSSGRSYGDLFTYEKSRKGKGLAVTGFRGDKNKTIIFQNRTGNTPVVEIADDSFSNSPTEELKNGTILTSESGNKYEVVSLLGAGGQGEVYDVKCGSNHYALKWYFKGSATERQKKILETIIAKGSPDESFLWPMELIVPAKSDLYGYIMPLRPKNYKSIVDLMKKRVNPSFYTLCRTAFNLTRGYQKLHAMGAKYQDISFGNLFFNPDNGDVLICDNDNVSFDNSKPGGVLGTPGFMAPEIVRGEKRPSKDTDRYSLSVLLFYLFMVNHPLEGKLEASIRCMDMAARVKLYGTDPVFIFDPNNKTNRPVKGIHDNATIYWPLYPEKLRQIFTKAFTVGLNEPSKRITEPEWMTLFSNMMSGMLQCSCGAQLFYDEHLEAKGVAHTCWNCGKTVQVPNKIIIGKNRVLLNQNTKLLHHHVYDDFDMDTVVGSVVQNPKNQALWGIRNEDKVNWTYQKADGTQIKIK